MLPIEVLPALVEWIEQQPDDVNIGHAIPVPGGFANDFRRSNLEL